MNRACLFFNRILLPPLILFYGQSLIADTISGKVLISKSADYSAMQKKSQVEGRVGLADADIRVIDVITEKEIPEFGIVKSNSEGQYQIKIPPNLPDKVLRSLAIVASKEENGQQIYVEVYLPYLNPKTKKKVDLNPETTAVSHLLTYAMNSQNDDLLEGNNQLPLAAKNRIRKQLDKVHKVIVSIIDSKPGLAAPVYYKLDSTEMALSDQSQVNYVKLQLSQQSSEMLQKVIDSHPDKVKLNSNVKLLKSVTKEVTKELLGDTMALNFVNSTNGKYKDDQIYIGIIGRSFITNLDGERPFAYINKDGDVINMNSLDNDDPDTKLTKNNVNYANYFFTLKQAKQVVIPKFDSSRIYIGLGSPVFIRVNTDINNKVAYAGPNLANPSDPNNDIYFDWFEFAFNDLGFFGNTTQVDQFGFPMTFRLQAKNYDETLGINEKRSVIFKNFLSSMPKAAQDDFKPLVQLPYRIVAPGKSAKFNATYMDDYIDEVWSYYSKGQQLTFKDTNDRTFVGSVNKSNEFVFTVSKEDAITERDLKIKKPTTMNVLEGSGPLAEGNDTQKVIGSFICAAFNRGVFFSPQDWGNSSAYYNHKSSNFYSEYWHQVGLNQKAYGFAYDDIHDHSTLLKAPEPKTLTINIGWD